MYLLLAIHILFITFFRTIQVPKPVVASSYGTARQEMPQLLAGKSQLYYLFLLPSSFFLSNSTQPPCLASSIVEHTRFYPLFVTVRGWFEVRPYYTTLGSDVMCDV